LQYTIGLALNYRTRRDKNGKNFISKLYINAGKSREETAKLLGISVDRYNRIATGSSKMLAVEFIAIHKVFNIPYENIAVKS